MVNPTFQQGTPTMFLCGDNAEAKQAVSGIVRQFGWEPYDCGGMVAVRAIEPLCILWCLRGFSAQPMGSCFQALDRVAR
jgi:predicted dinucleotide-binding enzyme